MGTAKALGILAGTNVYYILDLSGTRARWWFRRIGNRFPRNSSSPSLRIAENSKRALASPSRRALKTKTGHALKSCSALLSLRTCWHSRGLSASTPDINHNSAMRGISQNSMARFTMCVATKCNTGSFLICLKDRPSRNCIDYKY